MTSQILSINKKEVIMSTEDVETIGNEKTYSGVEKLFNISTKPPIGLMFHGPPIFEGIPVETLINEFKEDIKTKRITGVLDAKSKLLNFIGTVSPKKDLDIFINHYLKVFKDDLKKHLKNINEDEFYDELKDYNKEIPPFLRKYVIDENYFNDILPDFVKNNKIEVNLKLWSAFCEIITYGGVGIVIAGFDDEYHFSSFTHFNMIINNNGNIETEEFETQINIQEPVIRVYAASIGADLFLNGIDSEIEENLEKYFLNKTNLSKDNIQNSLNDMKEKFKKSIQNSIEWLPKKERIELNHTLIHLTALKQKISPNIETVGANIHSCILEKDKEFQWIK